MRVDAVVIEDGRDGMRIFQLQDPAEARELVLSTAPRPEPASGLARALSGEVPLGEPTSPPMAVDPPAERLEPVRVRAAAETATYASRVERLTLVLVTETRSENQPQAAAAAEELDQMLSFAGPGVPTELWVRAHKALCDYELFVRKRVEAGGHDIPGSALRRRFDRRKEYFVTLYKPLVDSWYEWESHEGAFSLRNSGGPHESES